jgi:hypothetical protein
MLTSKVSLHDIIDVEAFVIMCVKRSGSNAPVEYWDDLVAEGICLLYVMARNYKPRLNGYDKDGCFSGYAVKWLPKQIKQAWHKSQEHHLHATDPETGKRGWTFRLTPVSYEVAVKGSNDEGGSQQEVRMKQIKDFMEVPMHKDVTYD